MHIKTFVVNLEKEERRRKRIVADLDRLELNYEIVWAENGYALTDDELEQLCDLDEIKKHESWFTKGAIGCSLSHYYLYKRVINDNLPYAFIIEDDAKLPPNIKTLLEECITHLKEEEVVLFYYQSMNNTVNLSSLNKEQLTDGYALYFPVLGNVFNCTGAYLVTRAACERLANIILPVRVPADDWHFFVKQGLKSIRLVYPRPVKTYDFRSTISNRSKLSKNFLLKFVDLIDQYKIFPFYYFLLWRRNYHKNKVSSSFKVVNEKSQLDKQLV